MEKEEEETISKRAAILPRIKSDPTEMPMRRKKEGIGNVFPLITRDNIKDKRYPEKEIFGTWVP